MKSAKSCLYYYRVLLVLNKYQKSIHSEEKVIANFEKTDDFNLSDEEEKKPRELTVENEDLLLEEYERTETINDEAEQGEGLKQKLISSFFKNKKSDDVEDEDDNVELTTSHTQVRKKKRTIEIKPIHVVVIIGLLVVLLFDEEELTTTPTVVATKKKPKATKIVKDAPVQKQKEPAKDPKQEASVFKDTAVEAPVEKRPIPVETGIDEGVAANTEKVSDASKSVEVGIVDEQVVKDRVEDDASEIKVVQDRVFEEEKPDEDMAAVEEQAEVLKKAQVPEGATLQQIDDSVIDPTGLTGDATTDITKKLLSDLEGRLKAQKKQQELIKVLKPVAAPSYEAIGAALVYNCTGQHWACIGPKAYQECRQNYSWNKEKRIPLECYPFAEMDDNFDCASVQQEKINTIGDTSFCKN